MLATKKDIEELKKLIMKLDAKVSQPAKRNVQATKKATSRRGLGDQIEKLMNDGRPRSVDDIKKAVKLRKKQPIHNAVHYLKTQGKLVRIGNGVYRRAA